LTSNAFGHWLVEDLGSILYLFEKFPNSPVIVYKNASRFVFELLNYFDREVILSDSPIKVKSIIMITKQQDSGWMHPRDLENLKVFAKKINKSVPNLGGRVYATRRNLKRSPKNEIEVENLFKKFDFEIVKLEELDFLDEIALIRKTKMLAGVSGSWHFNCVWMENKSRVLDIVNQNYWAELPHRVCSMSEIDYRFYIYSGEFNAELNLEKLEDFLRKELS